MSENLSESAGLRADHLPQLAEGLGSSSNYPLGLVQRGLVGEGHGVRPLAHVDFAAADFNGNRRMDNTAPGNEGLYVFFNEGRP